MKRLLFIGDVHGKIKKYHDIIKSTDCHTRQVGDFGFRKHHRWHIKNIDSSKHKILHGNHDDNKYVYAKHSLGDYHFDKNNNLFSVRGAMSIDRHLRIEGRDWWRNEELSYKQFGNAIDYFELCKPKITLSHDCPQSIREQLFNIKDKSITSNGLQAMFEIHQPKNGYLDITTNQLM